MTLWYRAGVAALAFSLLCGVLVQAAKRDWLPPDISISQYGVGPHGWLFTLWTLSTAAVLVCFMRYRPVNRVGVVFQWLAVSGALVAALVRTDPSGLQQSWNSRVHTAGSVVLLAFLPFGVTIALWAGRRLWWIVSCALTAVGAVFMTLVLVSAAGVETAGIGPQASWALWQTAGVLTEMVILVVYAIGVRTVPAPSAVGPPGYRRGAAVG